MELWPPLSFTDNSGVRYLDQAWLRKATDIVEGKSRQIREDPLKVLEK